MIVQNGRHKSTKFLNSNYKLDYINKNAGFTSAGDNIFYSLKLEKLYFEYHVYHNTETIHPYVRIPSTILALIIQNCVHQRKCALFVEYFLQLVSPFSLTETAITNEQMTKNVNIYFNISNRC